MCGFRSHLLDLRSWLTGIIATIWLIAHMRANTLISSSMWSRVLLMLCMLYHRITALHHRWKSILYWGSCRLCLMSGGSLLVLVMIVVGMSCSISVITIVVISVLRGWMVGWGHASIGRIVGWSAMMRRGYVGMVWAFNNSSIIAMSGMMVPTALSIWSLISHVVSCSVWGMVWVGVLIWMMIRVGSMICRAIHLHSISLGMRSLGISLLVWASYMTAISIVSVAIGDHVKRALSVKPVIIAWIVIIGWIIIIHTTAAYRWRLLYWVVISWSPSSIAQIRACSCVDYIPLGWSVIIPFIHSSILMMIFVATPTTARSAISTIIGITGCRIVSLALLQRLSVLIRLPIWLRSTTTPILIMIYITWRWLIGGLSARPIGILGAIIAICGLGGSILGLAVFITRLLAWIVRLLIWSATSICISIRTVRMINIILVLAIIASILLIGLVRPLMACVRVGLLATFSDFVVFEILFKPIEKTYLSLVLLKLEIELTMNIRNSFRQSFSMLL